jgi:hypothetical protein
MPQTAIAAVMAAFARILDLYFRHLPYIMPAPVRKPNAKSQKHILKDITVFVALTVEYGVIVAARNAARRTRFLIVWKYKLNKNLIINVKKGKENEEVVFYSIAGCRVFCPNRGP